jgi:hypothetical protein
MINPKRLASRIAIAISLAAALASAPALARTKSSLSNPHSNVCPAAFWAGCVVTPA